MGNTYQKSYQLVTANLQVLMNSELNCLVLLSPAGLGKTTAILSAVKQLGLQKDVHFGYYNSYFTPLSFYQTLIKATELQKPRLLILDDVELILKDKTIINLLKAATWENEKGFRTVNYNSTHASVKNHQSINFDGKIILLLNEIPEENAMFRAILDRVLFTQLVFSRDEIFSLMKDEILPKDYKGLSLQKKQKAIDFIRRNASEDTKLSFRTLIKVFNNMLYAPDKWQELTLPMLGSKKPALKNDSLI